MRSLLAKTEMLLLNAEEVRQALPMADAIEAMKRAFRALARGEVELPARSSLTVPAQGGITLVMPARVGEGDSSALSVKVVSIFPRNRERGLPTIHALVSVLDPETGRVTAQLEGASLTAIRTGAVSGLATELLARPESRVATVFGTGPQARTQLEAVCTVRAIDTVRVCHPSIEKARAFAEQVAGVGPIPDSVEPTADPAAAVAGADIIATATTSRTPVFRDSDLSPGVHINAIGSFQPEVVEIPPETVERALIVVDQREAALEEAGDLIQPLRAGRIEIGAIHGELGDVLLGNVEGRSSSEGITLFKSVGLAVEDAVAAGQVLETARKEDLGREVEW